MPIYPNALALIGGTPLVALSRYGKDLPARLVAKVESKNPAGSVKDRIALAIVETAEDRGELVPGSHIVEATSGNTGIGLALVAAVKGYELTLTMPESMSVERRALLAAYGAHLVLTPASEGMAGAVAAAEELAKTKGWLLARQFENPANPEVHRKTTAQEIWADTEGEVDVLVGGVGTGGTITGVGQVLRRRNPPSPSSPSNQLSLRCSPAGLRVPMGFRVLALDSSPTSWTPPSMTRSSRSMSAKPAPRPALGQDRGPSGGSVQRSCARGGQRGRSSTRTPMR